MKGRERLIHAYIAGLGLTAVYVAAARDGAGIRIGATSDPSRRLARISADMPAGADIITELWCLERKYAERVVDACHDSLRVHGLTDRNGWWPVTYESAISRGLFGAALVGVAAQSKQTIRENAERAITLIETTLTAFRRTGALQSINRGYREYRTKCETEGQPAMRYAGWIWNFKLSLARTVAHNSRLDFGKIKSDIKSDMSLSGVLGMSLQINFNSEINDLPVTETVSEPAVS